MVAAVSARGSQAQLADIDVSAGAWVALLVLLVVLLAIDLARHRDNIEPTTRSALLESLGWVACAMAFGGVVAWAFGSQAYGEFLSGYLIEKSLSVDNVFVWAVIFTTFGTPLRYQHRVLFWGIFGALVLRGGFILTGTVLIRAFSWVLPVFGLYLIWTGAKVFRSRHDERDGPDDTQPGVELDPRPSSSEPRLPGLGLLRRVVPVSDHYDGASFWTRVDGRRAATPLLAVLVVVELTDVIFAVDSVPAILAISSEPFIVFSSNAFAILGLRAMYFLLASSQARFVYLPHALGVILTFVGVKMVISEWVHINTAVSLGVIVVVLVVATLASMYSNRRLDRSSHT